MATNGSPELLIVMGAAATSEQTEHVVVRLQEAGVHARVATGRGATVIGIDCRRTETSQHADRVLVLRPGSDAALALGMMQVIVAEGLEDRAFLAAHTVGWDAVAESYWKLPKRLSLSEKR